MFYWIDFKSLFSLNSQSLTPFNGGDSPAQVKAPRGWDRDRLASRCTAFCSQQCRVFQSLKSVHFNMGKALYLEGTL